MYFKKTNKTLCVHLTKGSSFLQISQRIAALFLSHKLPRTVHFLTPREIMKNYKIHNFYQLVEFLPDFYANSTLKIFSIKTI